MNLKVIHRLQAFSNAIRQTFVQLSTRFQLTVYSHGSSALAELLVYYSRSAAIYNRADGYRDEAMLSQRQLSQTIAIPAQRNGSVSEGRLDSA